MLAPDWIGGRYTVSTSGYMFTPDWTPDGKYGGLVVLRFLSLCKTWLVAISREPWNGPGHPSQYLITVCFKFGSKKIVVVVSFLTDWINGCPRRINGALYSLEDLPILRTWRNRGQEVDPGKETSLYHMEWGSPHPITDSYHVTMSTFLEQNLLFKETQWAL